VLETTFAQMAERIGEQWRALTKQDQERRESIANISHDLRTPLTSVHGYLETLSLKADTLDESERRRYLAIALAQSAKVGRSAQALFELARLEYGVVEPALEDFSLADLLQDVFQKFELPAQARRIALRASIAQRLPTVSADLGMIERVLTNLLDNAIRHSPYARRRVHRSGSGLPRQQGIRINQRYGSGHSGEPSRRTFPAAIQFDR